MKKEIKDAIEKRDRFLEANPHLKDYQNEIDHILDNTPDDKKLEALHIMLTSKLIELQEKLIKLVETVSRAINEPEG